MGWVEGRDQHPHRAVWRACSPDENSQQGMLTCEALLGKSCDAETAEARGWGEARRGGEA